MPRMYEFFRQGVRLELRPLKGNEKGPQAAKLRALEENADAVVACLGKGFEREGGESSQARRNPLLASMQTFSEGKLYVV